MDKIKLPPDTTTGAVALTITNLKRSLDFYQDGLGFVIHYQDENSATLGAGLQDILHLTEQTDAHREPGTTGLYHFAILVPTRLDLAHILQRIIKTQTPVTGFADHQVSEAIYLPDPDGNGIEIYRDRSRDTWWNPDGSLRMGTDPLDIEGLLQQVNLSPQGWSGLPEETRLGHMHLHVADLEAALAFYQEVLGFDLMMRYGPSAAFLSAGGYHHHIGINTWNGVGASKPSPGSVGMRYFTLHLPHHPALDKLRQRLSKEGIPFENNGRGLWLQDPSANQILVSYPDP